MTETTRTTTQTPPPQTPTPAPVVGEQPRTLMGMLPPGIDQARTAPLPGESAPPVYAPSLPPAEEIPRTVVGRMPPEVAAALFAARRAEVEQQEAAARAAGLATTVSTTSVAPPATPYATQPSPSPAAVHPGHVQQPTPQPAFAAQHYATAPQPAHAAPATPAGLVDAEVARVEAALRRIRPWNLPVAISGSVLGGLSTLLAGGAAGAGEAVTSIFGGWQPTCLAVAGIGLAGTLAGSIHHVLGLGDRAADARACLAKLRALRLTADTLSEEIVRDRLAQITLQHPRLA